MENHKLFALLLDIEEEIKAVEALQGPKGRRGLKGSPGKDFDFEEHKEEIYNHVLNYLKSDQKFKESLKGSDGKDFDFREHRQEIKEVIDSFRDSLKLSFSDLTEEEKKEIKGERGEPGDRGPRGQRGKPGASFVFEDYKGYFESLVPTFEDLTPDQRDQLKLKFEDLTPTEKGDLKLKFSDLSEEERSSLKLRFDHLTEDEKFSLKGDKGERGSRGQRGKVGPQGEQGEKGDRGDRGLRGLPGPMGVRGLQGLQGEPGEDAPKVIDIELSLDGDRLYFTFYFDDGSQIETDKVQLPEVTQEIHNYFSSAYSGGGNGGGTPSPSERLEQDYVAGETISAMKAVYIDNGEVFLCDNNTDFETATVMGVSLNGASIGGSVKVALSGEIEDSLFTFSSRELLYLGTNGNITNVANTTGFLTFIGKALGNNKIIIEVDDPFIL
jgi:hypothetical protein